MKFLRLRDFLLTVLFEDDDILAVDKPYGFNTHTNDSKIEHSEFIQDGLIEMLEKHFDRKLYIIHRLDQTTTGVIIFGKSPESAKKYAEYFFDREVQKTYLFITAQKSSKDNFLIDQSIVQKGKDLEATTELTFLNRTDSFELWQANPKTGRNHQIRIHAQAAGISILGDPQYGGRPFPFLCLHNRRIQFPNGITLEASPPLYFEDLSLLKDSVLSKALFEADRCQRLFFKTTGVENQCFRLAQVKNPQKELEFSLDHLGKYLLLNWHRDFWGESEIQKFSKLSKLMNQNIIARHSKTVSAFDVHRGLVPVSEFDSTWTASEENVQYELKIDSGASAGLFTNQRLQRKWLRENSKGKSVLNLFSLNGTFGLSAALGGASEVTSVDSNKNLLNWAQRNFQLNGLLAAEHKFLCRDSLVFLKQVLQKKLQYDLVICDAPSFARGEKTVFKIQNDLETLLTHCFYSVKPGGALMFSTSHESLRIDDLRRTFLKTQKQLEISQIEINCIESAFDFELPNEKVVLKSFLIHF